MKIRRFLSVFFVTCLLCTLLTPQALALEDPDIRAKAAILVDADSGTVLYDKNIHQELPMASITKVMSALLVLEAVDRGQLRMDQGITATESAMKGMLAPKFREALLGHAEVRQTYKVSGVGTVAGCYVQDGKLQRKDCQVRLVRDGIVIHEGVLASLQRFKDSVKEVAAGYECGLSIEKFNDIKEGDIVEAFTMEEIPQ